MFEWFPILHGKYFTYKEYLFLLTILTFSTLSIIGFTLGKFLNRNRKYKLRSFLSLKAKSDSNDDYFDARTDASSSVTSSEYNSPNISETETLVPKALKSGTKAGNFFNWMGWFFFSLFPGSCATFGFVFPMWFAAPLDLTILMLRLRYKLKSDQAKLYTTLQQADKTDCYEAQSKPLLGFYKKLGTFFIVVSIILPSFFNKLCVSAYQDYVGPIFGTASLSTQLTRFFQISKGCPPGPPCHMYATLPEDGATSVFINAQTDERYETIQIFYDTNDHYTATNNFRNFKDSTSFEIGGTDSNGERRVHSFLLDSLQPDTMYFFHIVYENAVQAQNYYRTLPDETSQRDLVIVQGGDMGDTAASREVTFAASRVNPDLIVLGGDIAYDNGMCECYFTWDYLFKDLSDITDKNGRLVPLVLAIGNHDAGLDSLPQKKMKLDNKSPLYMTFFPQHSKVNAQGQPVNEVPSLVERKSYHYHKIGKILILNMDSGYLEGIEEQSKWMLNILDQNPNTVKFAQYHCPIYFACKGGDAAVMDVVQLQREEWGPIFDRYKFAIAFENHEHHLKRTFPLKNNTRDDQGTLYIGNGQWGTMDGGTCESYNQTGIYENVQNVHHFWVVNVSLSLGTITNVAYNQNNTAILDVMSQKIEEFIDF